MPCAQIKYFFINYSSFNIIYRKKIFYQYNFSSCKKAMKIVQKSFYYYFKLTNTSKQQGYFFNFCWKLPFAPSFISYRQNIKFNFISFT